MVSNPTTLAIASLPSDEEEAKMGLHSARAACTMSPGKRLFNQIMTPKINGETETSVWNRLKQFDRQSVREMSVATPQRATDRGPSVALGHKISLTRTRSGRLIRRNSISRSPRCSNSACPSPCPRNYTQHACALADKEFEEEAVSSAQNIFEELLDTPSGRDFIHLQAAVLRARKWGTLRIELQRESVDIPWGVLFFKPSQLKALGWTSDQYLIVEKLERTSAPGKTIAPAVQAGLAVGDIIIGLSGEKIKDYDTFISHVKCSRSLSLHVVRPGTNPMEDDEDEEDLEEAEEYLMQRVLGQARKKVQLSLSRMRRMESMERIRHLDACV